VDWRHLGRDRMRADYVTSKRSQLAAEARATVHEIPPCSAVELKSRGKVK
jgi:hypothetical protein